MNMVQTARVLEELRTALGTTEIPDDQVPLILGTAAGVMLALTRAGA